MPRKRVSKSPPAPRSDCDDDDFFFDDTQSNSGRSPQEPLHRNAANARERARMRVLSKAFCRLKTTLPWVPADTKLSKLDTLRLAASYIAHLRALLSDERPPHGPMHPLNLAWPFAFQHGGSISCSISSRWSHSQPGDSPPQSDIHQNDQRPYPLEGIVQYRNYDKRYDEEEEMVHESAACDVPVQYSYNNYGFNKEHYYELRNTH